MSRIGVDAAPILPKCPIPVIPAVRLGTYRTVHTLICILFKWYPVDCQLDKRVKIVALNLKADKLLAFLRLTLIIMKIRFRASYFGQVAKTNLVCLCKSNQASCAKSDPELVPEPFIFLLVGFFSRSVMFFDIRRKFKPASTTTAAMSGATPSALRSALD